MKTKYLLYVGSAIPLVFFITTFVCGLVLGDYDHLARMVSELGAIGTRSQYAFTAGLLLCSVMSVLFVIGLHRTCRISGISAIPALIILSYSVSIAGAAVFPLPLRMHLIMGMPSILMILSPLLGFFLWKEKSRLWKIKQMSVFSFLVMSLGFLAYLPDVLSDYPGLKQRFFHVGWSIWFIYLSFSFARLIEKEKVKELY